MCNGQGGLLHCGLTLKLTPGERILQMVSSLFYALTVLALTAQTECSVLYFQSAQCGPCRQLEPALVQLQQEGWKIQKIDAPSELNLSRQYQIQNLPTLVVVYGDKEVDRVVGLTSHQQLSSRFSRAAARYQSSTPAAQATQTPANRPAFNQQSANQTFANQPAANKPIVRGQSPGSANLGEAFPMLADASQSRSNSSSTLNSAERPLANSPRTPNRFADSLAPQASAQQSQPIQPAQPVAALSGASNPGAASQFQNNAIGQNQSPGISLEAAMARAADATVRIKVEESNTIAHGTGTIVAVHGNEGLVLTCGHLFRDMLPGSKLTVDLFAGTPRQVNLVAQLIDFKADKEDVALLSVQLPVQVEPVPILPQGEVVQQGQPVFSWGCDHGNNPTRRDTKVTRINRYIGAANIEIEGAPAVGRSGGGLFDHQGRLMGVCNAACKEENEGIYAAGDVIYTQLARVNHAHLFQPSRTAANSLANLPTNNAVASGVAFASGSETLNASQPVVQAGFTTSNSSTSAIGDKTSWPDEDSRQAPGARNGMNPNTSLAGSIGSPGPARTNEQSSTQGPVQLMCIIRDANGKQQVVTIDQPSPALLQAIQQNRSTNR